jgi:NADH-quinone oxidoreductase subunit K
MFSPAGCLILATALFAIGVAGVIARRNMLIVLLSIEIVLNAVNLAFVTFCRMHLDATLSGQVFPLFVIAIAAAEAAVGLAIIITFFNNKESVDARDLTLMKH